MEKQICNIYIFLWCLYSLQGTLYPRGGFLSQGLLVVVLAMSLYYFIKVITCYKMPLVLKSLSLLLLLWTIYGFIIIIYGNGVKWVANHTYLKNIYTSILPIYTFYYFSKNGFLTQSMLRRWGVVFLMIGIICFNTHYSENLSNAIARGSNREEFTNNTAYAILSILPLLPLYYKKPTIQYVLLFVCMLYVLWGMKRGAILSGFVCSCWFLYMSLKEKGYNSGKKKAWRSILIVIIVLGAIFAVQQMFLTSEYFGRRYDLTVEGDSSGRDSIFINYLNFYLGQSNYLYLLIGNGADATVRLLNEFAHNDWLEIAINNGLIMIIIYVIYWINIIKTISVARKTNYTCYLIISMFFIIFLMKSFYSMSYSDITIYASSAFGFALANYNTIEQKVIVSE